MRKIAMVLMMSLAIAAGCSSDKSRELFETAQFEEKQSNMEHARKLYREIVEKYPDSPVAKQAAERLAVLGAK